MANNPNMVAIQTVTVGAGGAASIDFTNIPQTYTDLYLLISTREESTATAELFVKFNNTTSNLSTRWLRGNGASASSGTTTNIQLLTSSNIGGANIFSNVSFYIPNYTSSNYKSASSDVVVENNVTSSPDVFQNLAAHLWSSTAAINQITLYLASGDIAQYSTATLYGITSAAKGAKATGGIISEDADYYYHAFTASGTFTPSQNLTADYLVVAGGGGGGQTNFGGYGVGAGGGGGGVKTATSQNLVGSNNYTVTVGAGGNGGTGSSGGAAGSSSSISGSGISTLTATGGSALGTSYAGGTSGADSSNAGGGGGYTSGGSTETYAGGGGGGSGGVGGSWNGSNIAGNGGNGTLWLNGSYYGGGGGGGYGRRTTSAASGAAGTGTHGGGNGTNANNTTGGAGSINTGGGGGGAGTLDAGSPVSGAGGSGIVIIRYAK